MGFGIDLDVKVDAPKVETPAANVATLASSVTAALTGAVTSVASAVSTAVTDAADAAANTVGAALGATGSSAGIAGANADVDPSYTGTTEDNVLEPHLILDANANYEETQFVSGPIWIRLDLLAVEAKECTDVLHLFSTSGDYDRTCPVADFTEANRSTVDVKFEAAPMSSSFTLEIVTEGGETYTIFENVTYGRLRRDGKPTPDTEGDDDG